MAEAGPNVPTQKPLREQWFRLRSDVPDWQKFLASILCVAGVFTLWWLITNGEAESRVVSPTVLPSPPETFGRFGELWDSERPEQHLLTNTLTTLKRVVLGFLLATAIGVPLGILAGCFRRVDAFLLPLIIFGRNVPIAALTILSFLIFDIGETQKVMFIFLACVAFIIADASQAVRDVAQRYVDTSYTLGASRWQIILKVLVPLALPNIFNSLRLLFGLAFGYIMLAEMVKIGNEVGGLGQIILTAQRLGIKEYIYIILISIPLVAFTIDRALFYTQCLLFPYRHGDDLANNRGLRIVRAILGVFWKPTTPEGEVA